MGFCPNSTLSRPARKVWDLRVLCYLLYKLTLAAKAAFIHKILCFEVFVVLFRQLVDRMLKNKSQFKNTKLPHQESAPLVHINFFGLTHQEWSLHLMSQNLGRPLPEASKLLIICSALWNFK